MIYPSFNFTLMAVFVFTFAFGGSYRWVQPMVSVVMPTYNRAEFLPRSIESILNQSYSDFEFIIVDDGSTDNSLDIIRSYMKKDNRIRLIISDRNYGVIHARNAGQDAAKGKYIAIMDSDDMSLPDRLKVSVNYLQAHPDITVVSGCKKSIDSIYNPICRTHTDEMMYAMHFNNVLSNPNNMFRRDFVKRHHIRYQSGYKGAEDYDFWKQIIFAGGKIRRISDVVLAQRYHGTNSDEFYHNMNVSCRRISKEFLNKYNFGKLIPKERDCNSIRHMITQNEQVGFVSTSYLKKLEADYCHRSQK